MRRSKLGAVLASLAITTGAMAVLAAGPAQADTATQSTLSLGGRSGVAAFYGTYLGTFAGQVTDGTNPVTIGAADLESKLPGKSWKTVRTDDNAADGVSFGNYGSKAKGNVKYRVHYLGGTDTGTATTYSESFSNTVVVRTAWNLNPKALCQSRCKFYGKLTPASKNHKVLIQVKNHGWKRYRVVHTDAHSHWSVFVKATRGGALYRAVVAANKNLIAGKALGRFTLVGKSAYAVTPR